MARRHAQTQEVETFTFNFVKRTWEGRVAWDQSHPSANQTVMLPGGGQAAVYLKLWDEDLVKTLGKSLLVTGAQYTFSETHFLGSRNLSSNLFAWCRGPFTFLRCASSLLLLFLTPGRALLLNVVC